MTDISKFQFELTDNSKISHILRLNISVMKLKVKRNNKIWEFT